MSSCDAFMVTTSGLFTENLYKPLFPGRSRRHYLRAARVSSLLVVAAGVIFAYSVDDPVKALEIFWKIAPMLGVAFWMGLFWRRATPAGAWASTVVGFTAWWLTTLPFFIDMARGLPLADELRFVFRDEIHLPWQMLFYLISSLAAGVVISLLTPPVAEERLENFYGLVRTPVADGEPEVEVPCTLPPGVAAAPRRRLLPLEQFEINIPSARMISGFLAGWLAVAVLIVVFLWIIAK
jgi:Na+/proline symporter